MKNYRHIFVFKLVFICTIIYNCSSLKVKSEPVYDTECLTYYNYDNVSDLARLKDIKNLKELGQESLKYYFKNGLSFIELIPEQILFIPRSDIFKNNLKGNIPLYVFGYSLTGKIKQYLVAKLTVSNNDSSFYIINEANGKINSTFLVHSDYSNGFVSEYRSTISLSPSLYQVNIISSSDTSDGNGNYYGQFKITEGGHIEPLKNPVKKADILRMHE